MSELVMNASGSLAHGSGSPISGGVFVITSAPSDKTKAGGVGVFAGVLSFSFSGGNSSGFDPGSISGTGTISPSSASTKADGVQVIREGDSGTLTASGTVSGTPTPISGPVEVDSAGQTKARSE